MNFRSHKILLYFMSLLKFSSFNKIRDIYKLIRMLQLNSLRLLSLEESQAIQEWLDLNTMVTDVEWNAANSSVNITPENTTKNEWKCCVCWKHCHRIQYWIYWSDRQKARRNATKFSNFWDFCCKFFILFKIFAKSLSYGVLVATNNKMISSCLSSLLLFINAIF